MQLNETQLDQILHLLLHTRRLAKIALSLNAISEAEKELIFNEIKSTTVLLHNLVQEPAGQLPESKAKSCA